MNKSTAQTVAIIGASEKEGRYATKALELLLEKGHCVLPINPRIQQVLDLKCFPSIEAIPQNITIDTYTIYVRPEHLESYIKPILQRGNARVIFNPGTESVVHEAELQEAGLEVIEACTIVMLQTNQF